MLPNSPHPFTDGAASLVPVRILHLEDEPMDALLVKRSLDRINILCDVTVARDAREFNEALSHGGFDVILSDSALQDIDGISALTLARDWEIPFAMVCGGLSPQRMAQLKTAGATEFVSKDDLSVLPSTLARLLQERRDSAPPVAPPPHPMERLIGVVQELSLARDLPRIQEIVRRAARQLTGADGATFVLREGDLCHYADEDAIEPLWKGLRFPLETCISGWAMLNRQAAVIEDIYNDERIPVNAYRPTFVKSLVMVPIRTIEPIGAIGNYWATPHLATPLEIQLLQALADSASIAMENVALYDGLEARVQERTRQLEAANADLEAFTYSVSHDLRAPLRIIDGFSRILLEDFASVLNEEGQAHLARISGSVSKMNVLIEELLKLARLDRTPLRTSPVDLAALAREIVGGIASEHPGREVDLSIPEALPAVGDHGLLRIVLENLLSNAWKYSSKRPRASIEVGCQTSPEGEVVFHVRDQGAGFDPRHAGRLFGVFQRLHGEHQFPGLGIGLATVQRIVRKHGGRIWAEAAVDQGATFFFTLGS